MISSSSCSDPITLHCLEGRAQLTLPDKVMELSGGQWLYLEGGVPHAITGIEDTSLLLTILFSHAADPQDRAGGGAGARRNQATEGSLSNAEKLDSLLDEGLMGTFPASDPASISNPSTGIGITRHEDADKRNG